MRLFLLGACVVGILACGPHGAAETTPKKHSAADLSWMSGTWSCPKAGGEFQEHWMAPAGDALVGVGRLVIGGKTRFMEYLTVEPAEEGLTMWIMLGSPSKGPKEGRPFRLAVLTEAEAKFERKSGDFPSTITYRRLGPDAMLCRLDGMRNGQPTHEDYDFKRVPPMSPTAR